MTRNPFVAGFIRPWRIAAALVGLLVCIITRPAATARILYDLARGVIPYHDD